MSLSAFFRLTAVATVFTVTELPAQGPRADVAVVLAVASDVKARPWHVSGDRAAELYVEAAPFCTPAGSLCPLFADDSVRIAFSRVTGARLSTASVPEPDGPHVIRYRISNPVISGDAARVAVLGVRKVGNRNEIESTEYTLRRSDSGAWQVVQRTQRGS